MLLVIVGKVLNLTIDTLNSLSIPSICLAHGNELIVKNSSKKFRVISILNKVTHIVTNSNFTLSLVKDIGITNQKITCIYPGAQNTIHLNEEIISNINGQPVITTLARLEKRKGHAYILSVIAKLKAEYPNILYIIAGSGIEFENLKKITLELDIVKMLFFLVTLMKIKKNIFLKILILWLCLHLMSLKKILLKVLG